MPEAMRVPGEAVNNWTCHNCGGKGMYWHPVRRAMVLCHCCVGDSKRRWLQMDERVKRKERREQKREKVPF